MLKGILSIPDVPACPELDHPGVSAGEYVSTFQVLRECLYEWLVSLKLRLENCIENHQWSEPAEVYDISNMTLEECQIHYPNVNWEVADRLFKLSIKRGADGHSS